MYLNNLLLADNFGTAAVLATVLGVDALALALALDAHSLDLLHHARPDLLNMDLHPPPLAQRALLHGPLLSANACGGGRQQAGEMHSFPWGAAYPAGHCLVAVWKETGRQSLSIC